MRSPMIEQADYIPAADKAKYSDLQVMQSGAGWYVGTEYLNGEDDEFPGLKEPGSRDSVEYYPTKEAAAEFLAELEAMDPELVPLFVRMSP